MILQTISWEVACSNYTIVMRVPLSEAAQHTSFEHYPPLLHSISWCYVKLHHQWTEGNQKSETSETIQWEWRHSYMDKLLRWYGLPCYQKQGNEAEGNAGKLIFFLPCQGMSIWWKAKRDKNFSTMTQHMQIWAFRYSSSPLQPFLAKDMKALLSFPPWWRTTNADLLIISSYFQVWESSIGHKSHI